MGDILKATDFGYLFRPRGIAVVGASQDLKRIGGQPVRNLTELGYRGAVYPVNPKYAEIKGLPCYPDVKSVPSPCDLAVVAVAAQLVPGLIRECGRAGIRFVVILSSGFGETGDDGAKLQREAASAAREAGVRVVGPNCVGVLNLRDRMYCGMGTGFQDPSLKPGRVAMVTQSGGVGFSIVTLAERQGVGFSYVVSSGNEIDVSTPELIAYFLEQEEVEIVAVYMEGVADGRALLEVGKRALELGKPIVVWKSGRTGAGAKAAASHTANLTASYALYRAAFREGGFVEVDDVSDFADFVEAYDKRRLPKGRNAAIVTTSGGAGVVLADHCEEFGLRLADISASTETLRPMLPEFAAIANPLDMTAQGQNKPGLSPHNRIVKELLANPDVDQLIVRNGNVHGAAGETWSRELIEIANGTEKPIAVSWGIVLPSTDPVVNTLKSARVPCYPTPLRLVRAMSSVTGFAERRRRAAAARSGSETRSLPPAALDLPQAAGMLAERESRQVLARYGIPGVREVRVSSEEIEGLAELPGGLSFPVVVKIDSPDIAHKSEAGGVRLGIRTDAELRDAAQAVLASARRYAPRARIGGVLVQEMASGIETIVGVVNDATFGPTVMLGLGGIYTEVLQDVVHRFAPFGMAEASAMIEGLRAARILRGYRGQPPADVQALARALSAISYLAADHADRVDQIDINPLFVHAEGEGVTAADALLILK